LGSNVVAVVKQKIQIHIQAELMDAVREFIKGLGEEL
jgi:hypothetical protein